MLETDWRAGALCAQVDPELFYPEKGFTARSAKSICSGCDVRERCLQYALDNLERHGVWGGCSPDERLEILRQNNADFEWPEIPVEERDRMFTGPWTKGRTHCNRGHELTPENKVAVKAGGHRCRECRRLANARSKRAQRERLAEVSNL